MASGGKDKGAPPRRAGTGGPLRRWQAQWRAHPEAHLPFYGVVALVLLLCWLASGLYQLRPGEQGVLLRFGAYRGIADGGAGWHLPWPIDTLRRVDTGHVDSVDLQARMFTADAVLVTVTASIRYQRLDPRAVALGLRDGDELVRELGEAALRERVVRLPIAQLMGAVDRAPLMAQARTALQAPLDAMGSGIAVRGVEVSEVQVPEAVIGAQHERMAAADERDRVLRDARAYAAGLLPDARTVAQKARLDAEAYRAQAVANAESEAARFEPLAAAYAKAPEVTRSRLYIETIEAILQRGHKVVIDGRSPGQSLVVPLDHLGSPGVLRGAGVVGIQQNAAAAPTTKERRVMTAGAASRSTESLKPFIVRSHPTSQPAYKAALPHHRAILLLAQPPLAESTAQSTYDSCRISRRLAMVPTTAWGE